MKKAEKNLQISMTVNSTPKEVFEAINNVRAWWSEELKGKSDKLGAQFTYKYKDFHTSTQKVVEFVPNKKVVWRVSKANLSFVKNKTEWNGTDIIFEIGKKNGQTELHFTHMGLTPSCDCYSACNGGWGYYIKKSLRSLITKGIGKPNPEA